ncbi:MAG: nitrile hydratase subunit beta [Betaproteobacteria bacterium]|nr:nitrile hydratase subunit beta [Betaproteobacteria bacterium]
MNAMHDLGGMQGFGPVREEQNEPVFHAPWEGRVLGMVRSLLYTREWNIDEFRSMQERVPARTYLTVSYYHRWLLSITASALAHGLVTADELEAGRASGQPKAVAQTMTPGKEKVAFVRGAFGRTPAGEARFKPGDRVHTRNLHPAGHTRLPRYARDKIGTIERVHGCHVFPDAVVAGRGEDPQWLYAVAFDGRELWGSDADPALVVSIDAFEPYLEHA